MAEQWTHEQFEFFVEQARAEDISDDQIVTIIRDRGITVGEATAPTDKELERRARSDVRTGEPLDTPVRKPRRVKTGPLQPSIVTRARQLPEPTERQAQLEEPPPRVDPGKSQVFDQRKLHDMKSRRAAVNALSQGPALEAPPPWSLTSRLLSELPKITGLVAGDAMRAIGDIVQPSNTAQIFDMFSRSREYAQHTGEGRIEHSKRIALQTGLDPATVRVAAAMNPIALWEGMVVPMMDMSDAMLDMLVPFYAGLSEGEFRFTTIQDLQGAASVIDETTGALSGFTAANTLVETYGLGKGEAVLSALVEQPELVSAIIFPLAIYAKGWQKFNGKSARFDQFIKDLAERKATQERMIREAKARVGEELSTSDGASTLDTAPYAALAVRMLTRADPNTGRVTFRPLEEALVDEFGLDPRLEVIRGTEGEVLGFKRVLTPDEALRSDQLARLEDSLNRLAHDPAGRAQRVRAASAETVDQVRTVLGEGEALRIGEVIGDVRQTARPVRTGVGKKTRPSRAVEVDLSKTGSRSLDNIARTAGKQTSDPTRPVTVGTEAAEVTDAFLSQLRGPVLSADVNIPSPLSAEPGVRPFGPDQLTRPGTRVIDPTGQFRLPGSRGPAFDPTSLAPERARRGPTAAEARAGRRPVAEQLTQEEINRTGGLDAINLSRAQRGLDPMDEFGRVVRREADPGEPPANRLGVSDRMRTREGAGTARSGTTGRGPAVDVASVAEARRRLAAVEQELESVARAGARGRGAGRLRGAAKTQALVAERDGLRARIVVGETRDAGARQALDRITSHVTEAAESESPTGRLTAEEAAAAGRTVRRMPGETRVRTARILDVARDVGGDDVRNEVLRRLGAATEELETKVRSRLRTDLKKSDVRADRVKEDIATTEEIAREDLQGAVRAIEEDLVSRREALRKALSRPGDFGVPLFGDSAVAPTFEESRGLADRRASLVEALEKESAKIEEARAKNKPTAAGFRRVKELQRKLAEVDQEASSTPVLAGKPGNRTLTSLRDATKMARAKGLNLQRQGTESFILSSPHVGIVRSSKSLLDIVDAIDEFKSPPAPKQPKTVRPNRSSTDAEFMGLETITTRLKLAWNRLNGDLAEGKITPEEFNAANDSVRSGVFQSVFLGTLTPSQFSKQLGGASSSPFARAGESIGRYFIGSLMEANTRYISEVGEFRAFLDNMEAFGFRKGTNLSIEGYNIMDTFVTSVFDESVGTWKSIVTPKTAGKNIAVAPREGIPFEQRARAIRAWDLMSKGQRQHMLNLRLMYDRVFWESQVGAVRREMFLDVSEGRHPVAGDLEPRLAQEFDRTLHGMKAKGGPMADRIMPPGEPIGPTRMKIGPRIEAYAAHDTLSKLRDQLHTMETDLAPTEIHHFLATDVPNAFNASPGRPFRPSDNPQLQFTKRTDALRHLFPGVKNAQLGEFIKIAETEVLNSGNAVDRMARVLPTEIFSRYLAARRKDGRIGEGDLNVFARSYFPNILSKKIFDPTMARIMEDIRGIDNNQLQRGASNAALTILGRRPNIGKAGRILDKGVQFATGSVYAALLPAKPLLGAINMTQYALFAVPELGIKNSAPALRMLSEPAFWRWAVENRLLQETQPLDYFTRQTQGAQRGRGREAFAAARSVERLGQSILRMREAPTFSAARKAVRDAGAALISTSDFLAMSETYVRAHTIAHSLLNTFEEAGMAELAKRGKWKEYMIDRPELIEHATRRALIDVGNSSFFMGRGTNVPMWQASLSGLPTLQTALRPVLMLTSYPTGGFAAISSWTNQLFRSRVKGEKMAAARSLGTLFAAMTLIAGPRAVLFWVDRIDDEQGMQGDFRKALTLWEDNWSFAGRTSAYFDVETRDLAPRIGLGQFTPVPGLAVGDVLQGLGVTKTRSTGRVDMRGALYDAVADEIYTAGGLVRLNNGGSLLPAQKQAMGRTLVGRLFASEFIDVASPGSVPEDMATIIPFGSATKMWMEGFDLEFTGKVFPPVQERDRRGRPNVVRDRIGNAISTRDHRERIARAFGGASADESLERELVSIARGKDDELATLRRNLIRTSQLGDTPDPDEHMKIVGRILTRHPEYDWDPKGLVATAKNREFSANLTRLERGILKELSISQVRTMYKAAARENDDPKLRPQDRTRNELIIKLALHRIKKHANSKGR